MVVDPKRVHGARETARFADLSYDRFREMALDPALSANEKTGLPDAFREGLDEAVLADVVAKVPALAGTGRRILDIGSGCAPLAHRLVAHCDARGHRLVLTDSAEMLAHLPDPADGAKVPGRFPETAEAIRAALPDGADGIVVYGVLQVVFAEDNPVRFLDAAARHLAPGGALLVGDLPNVSRLRRFLSTPAGAAYHRAYMRTDEDPAVPAFQDPGDRFDDGLVLGLVQRMRAAGYDAYVLPQPPGLPLANRREDLLVVRP